MPSKLSQTWLAGVGGGNVDECAIPVGGAGETLGDGFGAIVFAVERLGVDVVVDQRGEDGAGHGGRVPAGGFEGRGGTSAPGLRRPWRRPATASRMIRVTTGGGRHGRGLEGLRRGFRRSCRGMSGDVSGKR